MDLTAPEGPWAAPSRWWRALPVLSQIVMVMSIPLYLGYFIKNGLMPGAIFMFMYPWSLISFLAVPVLCFAEAVILVRCKVRANTAGLNQALRLHALGLAVGLGAMLSVFLVRLYG